MKKSRIPEAIILLGHGSRAPDASGAMQKIVSALRRKNSQVPVEAAYLAMNEPSFPLAFERCARRGAKRIIVIPYFLHLGQHARKHIPRLLKEEARKFAGVEVILGQNLGYDALLVKLVAKRIKESTQRKK
jgi:sirohydrochlorin ferrochelatase